MPYYRLYCVDGNGRITGRTEFDAMNDAAAIQYARDHHPDSDCEIWELGRKVAFVPSIGEPRLFDPA